MSVLPPIIGGRLSHFREVWVKTVSDKWLNGVISKGYFLEFKDVVRRNSFLKSKISQGVNTRSRLTKLLKDLLEKDIIREVVKKEHYQEVYSDLFQRHQEIGDQL